MWWQGARRHYRRLFQAESEGGGSGTSAGCFPDFYSAQDFEEWLQGSYQGGPPQCPLLGLHCYNWVSVHKRLIGFQAESAKQFLCYAAPVFGANYSINPTGIILWIVHAVGILSMAAF